MLGYLKIRSEIWNQPEICTSEWRLKKKSQFTQKWKLCCLHISMFFSKWFDYPSWNMKKRRCCYLGLHFLSVCGKEMMWRWMEKIGCYTKSYRFETTWMCYFIVIFGRTVMNYQTTLFCSGTLHVCDVPIKNGKRSASYYITPWKPWMCKFKYFSRTGCKDYVDSDWNGQCHQLSKIR